MANTVHVVLLILCLLSSITLAESLIKIQSTLTEIWETNSTTLNYSSSTGYAVVIQAKTFDQLLGQWTPAAGSMIDLQVNGPAVMIVQKENGLFRQTLVRGRPESFLLNDMGRFSFFVPLSDHMSTTFLVPELAVKIVDEAAWTVAYLDHDAFHRLSAIDPSTLVSLNPNLASSSAYSASIFIQRILTWIVRNRNKNRPETHSKRQEQPPISLYNPITNDLPSRIVHEQFPVADAPFAVQKAGRPWMFTFNENIVRFSSDNITRREWRKRSFSDEGTVVPMEHLSDAAQTSSNATLSFVHHQGTLLSRLRSSNTHVISAIVHNIQHLVLALYVSLAHIGIRLRDLIDRIRNVFDWASVIRTHRFMNHFYKIMGPAQQKGLSLASDMVDQGIRAFLNETELQFDSFAVKRGASLLDLTGLLKDSKTSNEAYEDSYEPDAKTHYFMDRVIENAPNSELLEHTVAEEHEVELDTITREFSEEFAEQLDPRAYDSMHHNISDFFRHGSSVLNRPLDRTIRLLHNVLSFIDRSTEQFFGSVDKFMGKIMTLVMKLLDIPIYIPFLSHYWKDVIAPGFGHISILHLYTLVGSCQATWMYKLYRHGREPFNDRDIEVLESVSNPQLILYTWKSDPLTASNDADVAHKRMAIFDWIPRMCAATFVTLTKSIQIVIPNKFEMTHKVVKFTRYVSTYLINAWFFPVKQAEADTEEAVEQALNDVDPVIFTWWYGYVMGLSIRFIQPVSGFLSSVVERTGLAVAGSIQGLSVFYLLKRAHRTRDQYDHHQKVIIEISAVAWIMDTFDFFTGYIPGPMGAVISKTVAVVMIAAYDLRAHLMMALDVVGVLSPPPRDPKRHGRRIFA